MQNRNPELVETLWMMDEDGEWSPRTEEEEEEEEERTRIPQ